MKKLNGVIAYSYYRFFDKFTLLLLSIFFIYLVINVFSAFVTVKFGFSKDINMTGKFIEIVSNNFYGSVNLFIAFLAIIKISNELRNNNIIPIFTEGRELVFILFSYFIYYLFALLFLISISLIIIFASLQLLEPESMHYFNIPFFLGHILISSSFSYLLALCLVFLIRKAVLGILAFIGYIILENLIQIFLFLQFKWNPDVLPLNLASSANLFTDKLLGLALIYFILFSSFTFYLIKHFYKNIVIFSEE